MAPVSREMAPVSREISGISCMVFQISCVMGGNFCVTTSFTHVPAESAANLFHEKTGRYDYFNYICLSV
jgi:hypothetical protein